MITLIERTGAASAPRSRPGPHLARPSAYQCTADKALSCLAPIGGGVLYVINPTSRPVDATVRGYPHLSDPIAPFTMPVPELGLEDTAVGPEGVWRVTTGPASFVHVTAKPDNEEGACFKGK